MYKPQKNPAASATDLEVATEAGQTFSMQRDCKMVKNRALSLGA